MDDHEPGELSQGTVRSPVDEEGNGGLPVELRGVRGVTTIAAVRFRGPQCQDCELLRASRQLKPHLEAVEATPEWQRLSPRLREVARLLAEGLTDREVAAQIRVTPKTARDYAWRVLDKLALHTRRQLMSPAPPANAGGHLPVAEDQTRR